MKKLFPEAPDVSQSTANRAVKIIERHLRTHRVERACDLPEEAKVRLYRDLRFLFEAGPQTPAGPDGKGRSIRGWFARLWERIDNFLSSAEAVRTCGATMVLSCMCFGDAARIAAVPWSGDCSAGDERS